MAVSSPPTEKEKRKLNRIFSQVLPQLLRKPTSRWTKDELWDAIELYIKKPCSGMINWSSYVALEAKLKREPIELLPYDFLPRRGRKRKFTKEQYRSFMVTTEKLRQQIALERSVAITRVTYRTVARRLAERSFENKAIKPEYKIQRLAERFALQIKYLNKQRKSGEI